MDQSYYQLTHHLPLDRLVTRALVELEKLGYSRRSLRRYRTIWQHLIEFSVQENLGNEYTENLGARFIEAYSLRNNHVNPQRGWWRHIAFGVKVLAHFACGGRIERSRTDMQKVKIPSAMKKPLRDYEEYCRDRRHLRASTLYERIREIAIFLNFMGLRNLNTLDQIQPVDLTAFVTSRPYLKSKTLSRIISDVRSFLQFLILKGILHRDISDALPKIRVPRDATIPSAWNPELVAKLLKCVDRSSPKGKRDYVILLLASRLGLRLGDIKALLLDNLNWEAATIEIKQSKTLAPLCLPLTDEVGEALIDYLKFGRPQSEYREIFLKLNPPFAPFSKNSHLYYIVKYWKQLAGIKFPTQQHQGLHSLRHTLATQLLQSETPFHVISEILGHTTMASTLIYAKADVETLRSAALNTEEVRDADQ